MESEWFACAVRKGRSKPQRGQRMQREWEKKKERGKEGKGEIQIESGIDVKRVEASLRVLHGDFAKQAKDVQDTDAQTKITPGHL